jgi:multidrug efflux pump subunit AcrB
MNSTERPSGLLAWFVANPVAANLLMLLIWLGGAASLYTLEKDVFPRFSPPRFEIKVAYPGAGPREVEEAVCVPIEEAVYNLPGVKRLNTEITEGECLVKVEVLPEYDRQTVMSAARGRIQSIPHLPKSLERIEVREAGREDDNGVIWVALHGPADPLTLRRLGERIQQDLAGIPGVTQAIDYGHVPYEITVQVSSARLLQYRLSLREVAEAVRRASLDLAGGVVKTPAGELLLRAKGRAEQGQAVGELVLRTHPDGSVLRLRDVAAVTDGLEERWFEWRHDGRPAQGWEIHAERDTVAVARRVKAYVAETAASLPQGLKLKTWWDDSAAFDERIRTLLEDGLSGFLLVGLVLTLFLDGRVALWAGLGILTSVLGAFWWMPALGVSLNMLSLFGFLLAMGILVDDAIIIGESIHREQEKRLETGDRRPEEEESLSSTPSLQPQVSSLLPAIRGVRAVAVPVVLAVLIALVAFLPGLFLPGWTGQMMRPICLVMILTLVFSLVEALLILPAHLARPPRPGATTTRLARVRARLNLGLDRCVARVYAPFLRRALDWPWLILAAFLSLLLLTGALVAGGHVRQSFRADVAQDAFWVRLTVPPGSPYSDIRRLADRVEQALFGLRDELDKKLQGQKPESPESSSSPPVSSLQSPASLLSGLETMIWEQEAGFWLELSPEARQRLSIEDFVRDWRKRIGDIGRARIDFLYREGDVPYDLEVDLGATDPATVQQAAEALKSRLAAYPGVYDVVDSHEPGKPEVRLSLKPEAERLGLRLRDLAEQVRGGFFGVEAQRLQRGRNEVKVMVRYPLEERRSLDSLLAMPVSLPDGRQAPLSVLAEAGFAPGYAKLIRQDRRRVLQVQARLDPERGDLEALYADLEKNVLPELKQRYPELRLDIGEARKEQETTLKSLAGGALLALIVIYALIAVPFRSYAKPAIFLFAAPVAWCGGVLAHGLAGLPLSMESLVGMIAASGVVINDSLVLLDYLRERGETAEPLSELILAACTARFRPILLAFLTNFAGFLPTLLETSAQAQFLVPMTLSLSAGLLFGMAASLILTPVGYAVFAKSSG